MYIARWFTLGALVLTASLSVLGCEKRTEEAAPALEEPAEPEAPAMGEMTGSETGEADATAPTDATAPAEAPAEMEAQPE